MKLIATNSNALNELTRFIRSLIDGSADRPRWIALQHGTTLQDPFQWLRNYAWIVIPQPGKDSRFVTIEEMFISLAWKIALRVPTLRERINDIFDDSNQFAMGSKRGATKAIFAVKTLMFRLLDDPDAHIQLKDVTKAYPRMDINKAMSTLSKRLPELMPLAMMTYGSPGRLHLGNQPIAAVSAGVRQGVVASTLMFCLTLLDITDEVSKDNPTTLTIACADDLKSLGTAADLTKMNADLDQVLDIHNLERNMSKEVDLRIQTLTSNDNIGMDLHGVPVGTPTYCQRETDIQVLKIKAFYDYLQRYRFCAWNPTATLQMWRHCISAKIRTLCELCPMTNTQYRTLNQCTIGICLAAVNAGSPDQHLTAEDLKMPASVFSTLKANGFGMTYAERRYQLAALRESEAIAHLKLFDAKPPEPMELLAFAGLKEPPDKLEPETLSTPTDSQKIDLFHLRATLSSSPLGPLAAPVLLGAHNYISSEQYSDLWKHTIRGKPLRWLTRQQAMSSDQYRQIRELHLSDISAHFHGWFFGNITEKAATARDEWINALSPRYGNIIAPILATLIAPTERHDALLHAELRQAYNNSHMNA
jgi:hypothetical protein